MKKILVFAASNHNNLKLAHACAQEISAQGAAPQVVDLIALDLPLYSPVQEQVGIPPSMATWVPAMIEAHGMFFLAPEYNGGVPPTLVNFISWVSRSGDQDWRRCFNGKRAAIGTHSGSGGASVLSMMRLQLSYLGLNVVGRQVHTHMKKELSPEGLKSVVAQLLL